MQSLSWKNSEYSERQQRLISLPGLLFVLVVHAALFYFLWNQRLIPTPDQAVTLFAELIAPSIPRAAPEALPEPVPVKLQPAKKPVVKPKQERLVAKAPVIPKQEYIESAPEPAPVTAPAPEQMEKSGSLPDSAPAQMPTGPVTLTSELSVSCPKLSPPTYPAISRRMGEEGKLVLRVELDESGRIDEAKILNSSGYERLDTAALTAVKNWHCNPSLRNGQPVRAVALQPFNFVLQGN
ncbi:energy transducer TonB [Nitrosomonas ureae]|uniref:Protein TonB n=1 Tax=Nitrosomonas ureae TaxID=44577 RepID=A0A1H5U3D6_9PROT|nr:energy transducer TonB [Nitrosomonas ureae]SEF69632.1 outer membrane transport energization protein TonB [Nitrosomonas ureae]